jgi:glyoxylase-like metal-dependent hydrolase (beta-lactamase superfamily II)
MERGLGAVGCSDARLDGDKDVFGDGSIVIISTPGHTLGHASLMVNLREAAMTSATRRRRCSAGAP